jgi:putative transposase
VRPARESIRGSGQTYFVSSQTAQRRPFFRHERWAKLLQEVLEHYEGSSYQLHAYVIMPDHFHLLISPNDSLERTVQNIKGGFSFRAKRAFEWEHDIWQPGFSDHRLRNSEDWDLHIHYIRRNPVKARLCERPEEYAYLYADLNSIPQRLKPLISKRLDGGAEAPPLQTHARVAEPASLALKTVPRTTNMD